MSPISEMHAAVITYFSGEKRESLLFLAAGAVALLASLFLLWKGSPLRGMAWPLSAVALIQLVVGGTVYARTDTQARGLHTQLQGEPRAYATAELPRMTTVRRSFTVYKTIEMALLTAGLAGIYLFRDRQTLYAVSLGLALQAALMLAFDLAAERRADVYLERIHALVGALKGGA
jgi:hypothetical protein